MCETTRRNDETTIRCACYRILQVTPSRRRRRWLSWRRRRPRAPPPAVSARRRRTSPRRRPLWRPVHPRRLARLRPPGWTTTGRGWLFPTDVMLARTPTRHTRRCDATANTRVRLFPNVSVCGCVVRRGDDHRSGAERCVPARSVLGAFFNCRSGEASREAQCDFKRSVGPSHLT